MTAIVGPPVASFVIPVRNDARRLRQCLATVAVAARTIPHEVIVVDNGSTDDSVAVAQAMGARTMLRPGLRVSELRNEGARLATGELLAFVDADHEIDPGWLRAAIDVLRDPETAVTGCLCHAPASGTWVQRTYDALRSRVHGRRIVEWLGSGNLIVRRSVFDEIGGFDTSLDTCEDVGLCQHVRALGYRIVSDDRVKAVHLGDPATLGELFRSERWRGRDNLRVSVRRPWSARALVTVLIPLVDLLSVVGAAAAVAVIRPPWLAVLMAGAVVASLALLRAGRMLVRAPAGERPRLAHAFVVALVYDAARACALVTRASYSHRRREAR